ncbi:MAG: ATP12 family protein, partial [Pseudomonadota bacterium]
MSEWKQKRFWKTTEATEVAGGWSVVLDGRSIKTPAKTALVMPTLALAEAVAAEWDAQEDEINPSSMPLTRSANSAIDKVVPQRADVIAMLDGLISSSCASHSAATASARASVG